MRDTDREETDTSRQSISETHTDNGETNAERHGQRDSETESVHECIVRHSYCHRFTLNEAPRVHPKPQEHEPKRETQTRM